MDRVVRLYSAIRIAIIYVTPFDPGDVLHIEYSGRRAIRPGIEPAQGKLNAGADMQAEPYAAV